MIKKFLFFQYLIENRIPKIIPLIVAKKPIVKPVKKKFFLLIDCLNLKFLKLQFL